MLLTLLLQLSLLLPFPEVQTPVAFSAGVN